MKCIPTRPCEHCQTETMRQHRWLNMHDDPSGAATKLAAPKFRNCILVTPFNKAVFQFAIHRAQTFAASRVEPLFWMQAADKPPAWYAGTYGDEELQNMKQRWLQYHARKTEGILSLCPCCKGMPMRLTSGNSHLAREYGIHNGATCVVQGWELDPIGRSRIDCNPKWAPKFSTTFGVHRIATG